MRTFRTYHYLGKTVLLENVSSAGSLDLDFINEIKKRYSNPVAIVSIPDNIGNFDVVFEMQNHFPVKIVVIRNSPYPIVYDNLISAFENVVELDFRDSQMLLDFMRSFENECLYFVGTKSLSRMVIKLCENS